MGNPNVVVNVGLLIQKEINYKGSFRYGVSLYPLWFYDIGSYILLC